MCLILSFRFTRKVSYILFVDFYIIGTSHVFIKTFYPYFHCRLYPVDVFGSPCSVHYELRKGNSNFVLFLYVKVVKQVIT